MNEIQKQLFKMQDLEYKKFHSKLMPTVDEQKVIGIRIPVLRKIAKEFAKTEEAGKFIAELPHTYYEEIISTPLCWKKSRTLKLR